MLNAIVNILSLFKFNYNRIMRNKPAIYLTFIDVVKLKCQFQKICMPPKMLISCSFFFIYRALIPVITLYELNSVTANGFFFLYI